MIKIVMWSDTSISVFKIEKSEQFLFIHFRKRWGNFRPVIQIGKRDTLINLKHYFILQPDSALKLINSLTK